MPRRYRDRFARTLRFWRFFLIGLCLALTIAACRPAERVDSESPASPTNQAPAPTAPVINLRQPLQVVEALSLPELPDWIESISPTDAATSLSQIRVRFADPLIPLQQLDDPAQQAVLDQFEVVPEIPGQFRFLTPRMVGFVPEQALPSAARFQVRLKAGLADLNGHQLAQDLAWSFQTAAIAITNFPSIERRRIQSDRPIVLDPVFELTSNVELDLKSLRDHLRLTAGEEQPSVNLDVTLKEEYADSPFYSAYISDQARFDPSRWFWVYSLTPQQELQKATTYNLEVTPGLESAWGNLPSEQAFTATVQTYAPLAFELLESINQPGSGGAYGRFVNGNPQLTFNNGLTQESAQEVITIDPPAKEGVPLVRAYNNNNRVNLNPWALEPATTYTISVGADLEDQFGQALGEPTTLQYTTGDVAPDLWAPSDLHIFPSGTDLKLNISTINLPEQSYRAAYRPVQPAELVYTRSAYPREDGSLLPDRSTWTSYPAVGEKNKPLDLEVPLQQQLGNATGLLAYGVEAMTNTYQSNDGAKQRRTNYYGLVQLTNLGVFAQWMPQGGTVQVNRLGNGSPVAGATVEIYESKLYSDGPRPPAVPCAVGVTNGEGTWDLALADVRGCAKSDQGFDDPPELLTVAREGSDWAFVRTMAYDGAYGYGTYAGWEGDRPLPRGTIFSDRDLYKPGETAWFTGSIAYLQDGTLQTDPNDTYRLEMTDPNGDVIDLGTQTTNRYSTFSLQWDIPANQPLGDYYLRAISQTKDDLTFFGDFRIAEFKPPNFQVDLTLDRSIATVGDTIAAITDSQYLFGAPVQGGSAKYYVTRRPTDFQPEGRSNFRFGRQWFWPEEQPTISTDVLQATESLDTEGKDSQTVRVDSDVIYPTAYRVDVNVSDVSNLSVAASQSFVALPSDRLIGLKHNFVADAGEDFPVEVIVTDPEGKAIRGQSVQVELQQMVYSSVTQVRASSQTAKNQVEYKTVATATVRSGNEAKRISLVPPESGSYRIQANFANATDDSSATDTRIWATGSTPAYWGGRYSNNRLELSLDRETYKPGDTATVLIQSPYEEAELYFSVVRHGTLYKSVTRVEGGAPQIQFTVTPDMVPNAAVEAVLVRRGESVNALEPGSLDKLVKIGLAPFDTELDDQYLQVNITPQSEELAPGEEQTVELALKDAQGQPMQGQFTVMAVNEAVLQLTGYRLPDLVDIVYAEQDISLRFADSRPDVVLAQLTSPLAKGWGYGGGLSAATANPRVRDKFEPIAFYNGAVETDAQGRAQVSFTLPDNLTTWRVMAIATDGNLHYGQSDTTFITTQPLITNPILPQFARPGDRFQVGVAVTNTTDTRGNLAITGALAGNLAFTDGNDPTNQQLNTQVPPATEAYRFEVEASQPGESTIQFTSRGNNSDAFSVPLEIAAYDVTEQVIETGRTSDRAVIPLKVAEDVVETAGGLEITLASTIIPELSLPIQRVFDPDRLPLLETIASRLSLAASIQSLSQQYGFTFGAVDPPEQVNLALTQLQNLQQSDGGFGFWLGSDRANVWITPYAAEAIAQVQQAGFVVDTNLVNALREYLRDVLADPTDYCESDRCQTLIRINALVALDELGDRRADFLSDLYTASEDLDTAMLLKLTRHLSQFPNWSAETNALANYLQQLIYQTGRSATINPPESWSWLNSPTKIQAEALRLFSDRQSPPEVRDRLVQGLLDQRRGGSWGNTYDNAIALRALVNYSGPNTTPPNFTAQAELAGTVLTSAQFQGYQSPSVSTEIPMNQLPKGENDLVIAKTGAGDLHYLAAYEYQLADTIPGRMNGLRITRTVQPVSDPGTKAEALTTMDLRPSDGVEMPAGQVFDIGLEIITDHPVNHVVITDPLPAGLEAVDTTFQTATNYFQPQADSWQIRYQTIAKDKVQSYADHLETGVYSLHYLVRSVTPGTFSWPGAETHLQYAPEEFGRSTSATLKVG
ncbi:MAG: alpha-2-macroglobulin family protein [Cyanothece sp. SIO2G6]|nr:alpha-2-macroglobulin family protein [Cyanothece sp. SIO2G6]